MGRDVILDDRQLYNAVSDQPNQESNVLKELALGMHNAQMVWGDKEMAADYQVSLDDLQASGGSLYIPEIDVVIAESTNRSTAHPESPMGKKLRMMSLCAKGGFQLNIEIVDPNNVLGDRFINFGGKVFRIKKIDDPTRKPGIYYTGNIKPDGDLEVGVPGFMEFHELSGADGALAMYRTVDEAQSLGNLTESLKRQFEVEQMKSKLEVARLERQIENDKAEHQLVYNRLLAANKIADEEREQHKRRIDELNEKIKTERERESARLRDEYERRSHERKDSSEILKWIPTILGVVTAIILLVLKLTGG